MFFCILALVIQHANNVISAPYCHLWSVWLYHIFLHYLLHVTNLRKYFVNVKCVFWITVRAWNISHSKKNSKRYHHTSTHIFMQITRNSSHIIIHFEYFRRFSNNPKISNFMKIRWVGAELLHAVRHTDSLTARQPEG